jgi:hypothetical protein
MPIWKSHDANSYPSRLFSSWKSRVSTGDSPEMLPKSALNSMNENPRATVLQNEGQDLENSCREAGEFGRGFVAVSDFSCRMEMKTHNRRPIIGHSQRVYAFDSCVPPVAFTARF